MMSDPSTSSQLIIALVWMVSLGMDYCNLAIVAFVTLVSIHSLRSSSELNQSFDQPSIP
jgi:hypothetical protein